VGDSASSAAVHLAAEDGIGGDALQLDAVKGQESLLNLEK
jgi:hypothetical protein